MTYRLSCSLSTGTVTMRRTENLFLHFSCVTQTRGVTPSIRDPVRFLSVAVEVTASIRTLSRTVDTSGLEPRLAFVSHFVDSTLKIVRERVADAESRLLLSWSLGFKTHREAGLDQRQQQGVWTLTPGDERTVATADRPPWGVHTSWDVSGAAFRPLPQRKGESRRRGAWRARG